MVHARARTVTPAEAFLDVPAYSEYAAITLQRRRFCDFDTRQQIAPRNVDICAHPHLTKTMLPSYVHINCRRSMI